MGKLLSTEDNVRIFASTVWRAVQGAWQLNKTSITRIAIHRTVKGRIFHCGASLTSVTEALLLNHPCAVLITANGWELYLPQAALDNEVERVREIVASYELLPSPDRVGGRGRHTLQAIRLKAEKTNRRLDKEFDQMAEELPPLNSPTAQEESAVNNPDMNTQSTEYMRDYLVKDEIVP